jgi:hypothetical protein
MSTSAPEQDQEQAKDAYLDLSQLTRFEYIGMASGVLLLIALFLPWFSTGSNEDAGITTAGIGPDDSANAFQVFRIVDWLLVALSFAPFILAWIVARRHKLDWPTGEVTMVTGLIGIFLVLCNGLILGKPKPAIEVSLDAGWFLGLLGCIGIFTAGLMRQGVNAGTKGRKPPGSV